MFQLFYCNVIYLDFISICSKKIQLWIQLWIHTLMNHMCRIVSLPLRQNENSCRKENLHSPSVFFFPSFLEYHPVSKNRNKTSILRGIRRRGKSQISRTLDRNVFFAREESQPSALEINRKDRRATSWTRLLLDPIVRGEAITWPRESVGGW